MLWIEIRRCRSLHHACGKTLTAAAAPGPWVTSHENPQEKDGNILVETNVFLVKARSCQQPSWILSRGQSSSFVLLHSKYLTG